MKLIELQRLPAHKYELQFLMISLRYTLIDEKVDQKFL